MISNARNSDVSHKAVSDYQQFTVVADIVINEEYRNMEKTLANMPEL